MSEEMLQDRYRELLIIREVNIQAENLYSDAECLGSHAAYALTKKHRSQMSGLENIANSAFKISDILDYVKRQTARFSYWRKGSDAQHDGPNIKPEEGFGMQLKAMLERDGRLAQLSDSICNSRKLKIGNKLEEDRQLRHRVQLLLIRQFLRQVVIQYEFIANNIVDEDDVNKSRVQKGSRR